MCPASACQKRSPAAVFFGIKGWRDIRVAASAVERRLVDAATVFIDATHIKASANKKKNRKVLAEKTTIVYDQQLRAEIEAGRDANGKKPPKDKDDD